MPATTRLPRRPSSTRSRTPSSRCRPRPPAPRPTPRRRARSPRRPTRPSRSRRYETATLQPQADAAKALAEQSAQQAGQLAAQLMRDGDPTVNLLVNTGSTEDLLGSLEMSNRVGVQSSLILEQALQDKNSAQALTDKAEEAKVILEELKVKAEAAFQVAQAAATAAATAFETEQTHQAEMKQQLIVLKERRAATEADYLAGVRERWGADASNGYISESGWTARSPARITDVFGWRLHPIYGAWRLHAGTDIGAGCGTPIFAAGGRHRRLRGPVRRLRQLRADRPRRRHPDRLRSHHERRHPRRGRPVGRPRHEHRPRGHDRRLDRLPPALRGAAQRRGRSTRRPSWPGRGSRLADDPAR